jgi:F-type H+-transporting ATPase subunit b
MIDINGTLLAQIFNFLLLVIVLAKFAYKPLMKGMADRQAQIVSNIETAEKERAEAEALKREYHEQLMAARTEAQAIVEKARKLAEESKEEILAEARAEHARLLKAAQDEIARERDLAVAELKGEVVTLSLAAATKIIGNNLDASANAKLVNEFIDKLDEKKIGGLPC